MKKPTSPQSYPAIRKRSERQLVFARPLANRLMAFLGLVLFGSGVPLAIFLDRSTFEGSFWVRVMMILVCGGVAYVLFMETFHVDRLSVDLKRKTWKLRRGIGPRKARRGDFEHLSHVSLESDRWELDDSPAFDLWSVWLHFKDPATEKYCLGVRPRGLRDLRADHERQARDLLEDFASTLGLPMDEKPRL